MSERYTRLFSLPENLGQDGCPVLISAGALLKDNNTGKVLVQLKLRNISEQVIKSVKVKINAYDTAEIALKGVDTFSYLDLSVGRDGEFGSQTPIVLPDKTTRSFDLEIVAVIFSNGEQYVPSIKKKASIAPDSILQAVHQRDLEKQSVQSQQKAEHLIVIPAIVGIIAVLYQILWNVHKLGAIPFRPNKLYFTYWIRTCSLWFKFTKASYIVKAIVFPCFFIPLISLICIFFSKKSKNIRYIGILIALCYSMVYTHQQWQQIRQYSYAISHGYSFSFNALGLLAELLPIIISIISAAILFVQARISQKITSKS